MACDETSIAAADTLASRIRAIRLCRAGASGVVNWEGTDCPAIRVSIVPISPVVFPTAANKAEEISGSGFAIGTRHTINLWVLAVGITVNQCCGIGQGPTNIINNDSSILIRNTPYSHRIGEYRNCPGSNSLVNVVSPVVL